MTTSDQTRADNDPTTEALPRGDPMADALAAVILDGATELSTTDHLTLIKRCADAASITKTLASQAVAAARSAGHSWTAIGAELGMSRQAAQQRFKGGGHGDDANETTSYPSDDDHEERWLGPVTAFDEMAELELAGRNGWHTVGAGLLKHRMVRTDTQWHHQRLIWPQSTKHLLRNDWQIAFRAFPWVYLVRDTGIPVDRDAQA